MWPWSGGVAAVWKSHVHGSCRTDHNVVSCIRRHVPMHFTLRTVRTTRIALRYGWFHRACGEWDLQFGPLIWYVYSMSESGLRSEWVEWNVCMCDVLYYCIWMYVLRAIAIVRGSALARIFVDGFRFDTRDGCETGGWMIWVRPTNLFFNVVGCGSIGRATHRLHVGSACTTQGTP